MHFPHQLGKRDGKINWIGRSEQFGAFWATLLLLVIKLHAAQFFRSALNAVSDGVLVFVLYVAFN